MKQWPLRIAIFSTIIVCITAIYFTIFFLNNNDADNKEASVVNSQNYSEDKNAQHRYIIISIDGKYTFANMEGERATDQLYDVLSVADNGMFYFKQGNVQGFLGENLQRVFVTEDIISTNASEGFVIYSANNKKGFIDITTGQKIGAAFDAVYDFSEGLAAVQIGNSTGFINTFGELVIPCQFSNNAIYRFTSGICNVMTGSKEEGNLKAFYINKSGAKLFAKDFDYCMPFSEDRAFVNENGYWYIIDTKGEKIGDMTFGPYTKTVPSIFKEGRAVVVKDGKYGIIDKDGQYVVMPKYDLMSDISDGGVVFAQDGLFGYMDTNGNIIIAPRYENLSPFRKGLAVFLKDHKYGVIDRAATVVVNPEFEEITILDNGLIKISLSSDHFRYVDKYGKTVYETE
ncbi:MAG: WG repeat-containing protein [Monoglobales bacterium]